MDAAMSIISLLATITLGVGCGDAARGDTGAGDAGPVEPSYLAFQMFNYGPGADTSILFSGTPVRADVEELVTSLEGLRGDAATRRQLAFVIGPLTLNHADAELERDIREAFAIARDLEIAVGIHIDDSMMWERRVDLTARPDNVEWTDWSGTVHEARVIGWLPEVTLAPPICYESPVIRAEIERLARDVIGATVADELSQLRDQGKEDLFAGVIAGWETRLDDDTDPRVQFGYCSLTHRRFSADSPPADFDLELERIVQRWIEHWAVSLAAAGIPADRIYSHVAAPQARVHAPPWTAYNTTGRAGFSVYANDVDCLYGEDWQSASRDRGAPRWAMAEGTNVDLGSGAPHLTWDEYLGHLFGNGAALVTIFAWQARHADNPFGGATRSSEALDAYRSFLGGEPLTIPEPLDGTRCGRPPCDAIRAACCAGQAAACGAYETSCGGTASCS
jgi:hypothetical protein